MKPFIAFLLIAAMAIPQAKPQLGLLRDLLGSVNIQGTVFCTFKDNVAIDATTTPVFPNAQVELMCGEKVFSSATTGGDGKFSIMMNPLVLDLSSIVTGCNLVVDTPLSKCNSKLPSAGGLISTLQFVGVNRVGTQTITNIIPSGFRFLPLS
ncbi:hypothetical protein RJT34_14692 [Clitoria ternatea]|uniref:Uncharacterized protein n=1 Tax=Clitoria ternatea TaxID=43366 RepID=A0AAN9JSZ6_CLITE